MDEITLKTAFDKSGSDKSSRHRYEVGYAQILPDDVTALLEIGIANAHVSPDVTSLTAWAELFPDAVIVGADIVPEKMMNKENIKSFLIDQSSEQSLSKFKEDVGMKFDVIIDDGSHMFSHAKITFKILFDLLEESGIYIIEDIGKFGGYGQSVDQWRNLMNMVDDVEYGVIDTYPENKSDDSVLLWIKRK
jgi:hypothetical protein